MNLESDSDMEMDSEEEDDSVFVNPYPLEDKYIDEPDRQKCVLTTHFVGAKALD